jgi:hypothetical protein
MDSEYVVEVEVQGFAVEGQVAVDGSRLTAEEAQKANDEKRALVEGPGVEIVDVLQREDGSGIFYFRWDPPAEAFVREHDQNEDVADPDEPEHAAQTWQSAKLYTEHVASSVAGAGFLRVEHRIVTRDRAEDPSDQPE